MYFSLVLPCFLIPSNTDLVFAETEDVRVKELFSERRDFLLGVVEETGVS